MVNRRFVFRIVFGVMAVALFILSLCRCFDTADHYEQGTCLAILVLACVQAIRCFED